MDTILLGTPIITIGIMVILYVIAKKLPVSITMRRFSWLLILPALILPPILLSVGVLNFGKDINTFLTVTAFAAICIAVGAGLAFRIGIVQVYERYTLLGVIAAIIAPLYLFLLFFLCFLGFWG